jgi:DNA-binding GntR family transcriptional regulator
MTLASSVNENVIPFSCKSLRTQVAERLRCLIAEGVYRPGDRLIERELCERLEVSRPSIREAVGQLEVEGLVDVFPSRSAVVRKIDANEMLDVWEVRFALERLIARRFATCGTEQDFDQLDLAIRTLEADLQAQDKPRIRASKNTFFQAFGAGSHNKTLASHFQQLTTRLSFLWSSSLMVPGRPAESIYEKFALLSALRARNADAAEAAIVLQNDHAKAIAMCGLRAFEESRREENKSIFTSQSRRRDAI